MQVEGHPWSRDQGLDFACHQGCMDIRVLFGLHSREERDMAGGMGTESTECRFLEALGLMSGGRGCCSKRETGH